MGVFCLDIFGFCSVPFVVLYFIVYGRFIVEATAAFLLLAGILKPFRILSSSSLYIQTKRLSNIYEKAVQCVTLSNLLSMSVTVFHYSMPFCE